MFLVYLILHQLDLLLSPCLCACDPFLLQCPFSASACPQCPCLSRLRSNATFSSGISPVPQTGAISASSRLQEPSPRERRAFLYCRIYSHLLSHAVSPRGGFTWVRPWIPLSTYCRVFHVVGVRQRKGVGRKESQEVLRTSPDKKQLFLPPLGPKKNALLFRARAP